ncbi:DMT family transporter [Pedobacter antarcticus]|uniref:DMT family transporter n=1 Tax=Pedobacter antarcticus TaxID=34086 RepID=UPI001C584074|nr:DMT family transporter [Pedobacter antarcticus]
MRNKKTYAIILLIFTMLVWGSSYTVTKSIVNILPPACFALVRFVIASLCLMPFYLFDSKRQKAQKFRSGDIRWLFLMGLSGITGYYIFFNYSLMYTSASSGALIQGFIPVCIALLGVVFLKEKLTGIQITGIGMSLVGVILVGLITNNTGEKDSLAGNLLMMVAVLCWTTYTLISRKLNHLHPLKITFWSGCIGTVLLIPISIYEFIHLENQIEIGKNIWWSLIYLGAISSGFCYLLYNRALEILTATTVGNFLNLDILTGVVIAVIFMQDQIDSVKIVGGILILSGLIISTFKKAEPQSISIIPPRK